MVSGIVEFKDCILADNEARLGPAVYNAVTVLTNVLHNKLRWDESSFLDWINVRGRNIGRYACEGRRGHSCERAHRGHAIPSAASLITGQNKKLNCCAQNVLMDNN